MASKAIMISDTLPTYDLDQFVIPSHYREDVASIVIPNGLIRDRVERLAQEIYKEYRGRHVQLLCVLKGGQQLFADLLHYLKKMFRYNDSGDSSFGMDFVRAKSYVNDQSIGDVEIIGISEKDIKGKHVLLVEDIIDTGKTMSALTDKLKNIGATSVKVASLLVKRTALSNGFQPDFVGFSIPDAFVVGYCLDYNERFRDLEHICVISDKGMKKHAQ